MTWAGTISETLLGTTGGLAIPVSLGTFHYWGAYRQMGEKEIPRLAKISAIGGGGRRFPNLNGHDDGSADNSTQAGGLFLVSENTIPHLAASHIRQLVSLDIGQVANTQTTR